MDNYDSNKEQRRLKSSNDSKVLMKRRHRLFKDDPEALPTTDLAATKTTSNLANIMEHLPKKRAKI